MGAVGRQSVYLEMGVRGAGRYGILDLKALARDPPHVSDRDTFTEMTPVGGLRCSGGGVWEVFCTVFWEEHPAYDPVVLALLCTNAKCKVGMYLHEHFLVYQLAIVLETSF